VATSRRATWTGARPFHSPWTTRIFSSRHAGEPLGIGQAEAVGDGRALADADQEDPLGMHVQRPAHLADRAEDAFLDRVDGPGPAVLEASAQDGQVGRLGGEPPLAAVGPGEGGPPAEGGLAVAAGDGLGAAEAQAHVVPPAHRRHRAHHLLFVGAAAVEHGQERVGVVRLVPLRDESRLDERGHAGR